ncbi:MAG: hypothetical protein KKF33_14165 [Alphaproteobacteria bacterium]|nr:hypothetical protein [Alphaproteobacteria bacterium]
MDKKSAEIIFNASQECISILGKLLRDIKENTSEEEFLEVKLCVAQSMGGLVDICEQFVYKDHESMRPYTLAKGN